MPEREPEKPILKQVFEASSIGINLVISSFAGLAIGYGLDRWLGTSPYLLFIFFFLGTISGFRELLRAARKQDRQNETDDQKNK